MALKRKKKRAERTTHKSYPKITLQQALDIAIAGKKAEGLRERTLTDYMKMWGYFIDWLAENYSDIEYVNELTADIFRNYINYLQYDAIRYDGHKFITNREERGLKETTINIRLRTYRSMLNYLEREELIEYNPMDNVRLLRQDIDLTNCLTEDEVKAVLAQPNQRDYVGFRDFVIINLLLDSGLRINEALNLRVEEIDFKTRFITLTGERNKNRKPRYVPISAFVAKLLLQLIEENRAHFKTDRIFLSCFGELLGANHFNKRLKYYAEKAGIKGKKVTAHVYRHTWAKNMILNGCDPFTLQKMGGWADMRTMRRYIQMDTEEIRRSHDDFSPITKFYQRATKRVY
ncbi:integrase [Bacillus thuringiensis]|uniref:tyrosine-type recombinase/integrase n=1 Tax=Bacillus cereus group TaxID=86661 RepID=UPI000BF43575|nr:MULTISPECIES: tyrosine-type recombinase/integrase [Bacillus cereus group]MEB8674213.1 tyrosine-type recombinase/integrase [Bacillus cereus]PGC99065.1 integrase [Bacillus toyonensis]PGN58834.1 integrase [Bacillus thuringiensis]